jgi:DNA-binding transcriptional MerR regulator
MPEQRLVTVSDAAEEAQVSRTTVFRYIRLGLLKPHRRQLDRRTYIDVEALLELRRNPPFIR